MAIFGWFVMLIIALYAMRMGFVIFTACLLLKGRIDGEGVFGLIIMVASAVAMYFLYKGAPFSISFN